MVYKLILRGGQQLEVNTLLTQGEMEDLLGTPTDWTRFTAYQGFTLRSVKPQEVQAIIACPGSVGVD